MRRTFLAVDERGVGHWLVLHPEVAHGVVLHYQITTSMGAYVNRIARGSYEIASTGVKLTSDDPDAP